jgi:hypothetical protein
LLGLALIACDPSTPTQIVATVRGDTGFVEVAVEVDGVEEARTALPTDAGDDLPLTLTLVHGGGGLGPIAVAAVAYSAGGEVVAKDCEPATFRRGAIVEVELTLRAGEIDDCNGEPEMDGGITADGGASCDPVAFAATDPSAICVDDRCVIQSCGNNRADCDPDVAGCETNTKNDPLNCGDCGIVCPSGSSCRGGHC